MRRRSNCSGQRKLPGESFQLGLTLGLYKARKQISGTGDERMMAKMTGEEELPIHIFVLFQNIL